MPIYSRTKTNYRKIYEEHYGPIPKGYHIHHIDGNHENNDINNLAAMPAKEHYDAHFEQGDYGACWAMVITGHLSISNEERSFLTSIHNKERLENGTHFFLSEDHKKQQSKRMNDLSKRGLHPWQKQGYHKVLNLERIQNGTHNWQGSSTNLKMLKEGNHPSQKQWTCEVCGKTGKGSANYKRWHGDNCRIEVGN